MENPSPQTPSQEQARVVPDATPRPWHTDGVSYLEELWGHWIEIENPSTVAYVRSGKDVSTKEATGKANAELIVRAVNSFDALVEALQELYDATPKGFGNDYGLEDALKKTEAALKLARV